MGICCCSLTGTKACFACPNSMAGTWDRYPPPFHKEKFEPDIPRIWIPFTPPDLYSHARNYGEIDSNAVEDNGKDELVFPV